MTGIGTTFDGLVAADARLADKIRIAPDGSGCWWWVAAIATNGYGRYWRKGASTYAHRVVFELAYGIILDTDDVLAHTCDEASCVRPDHLRIADQAENLADARRKGRSGRSRAGILDPRRARGRALAVREALAAGWDSSALEGALSAGAPIQPSLLSQMV